MDSPDLYRPYKSGLSKSFYSTIGDSFFSCPFLPDLFIKPENV